MSVAPNGTTTRPGVWGPLSPADGYGPVSDDPVSYQRYFTKIANPGPTGIFAFAMTTFLWSLYNVHSRGVHSPNAIIGMGLFVGGLVQFMAGMWEFPRGNVFGSAMFTLYGAFWISYSIILIPAFGIASAYATVSEFNNAFGLYLIVWFIVTMLFLFSTVRRSVAFSVMLAFWALTFLMIAISNWNGKHSNSFTKAGGAFGFVTAIVGFYIGTSQLLTAELTYMFRMPLGHMGRYPAGSRV